MAEIREAEAADIDRLVEIETRVFVHDRLSRRSFRTLIDRDTADVNVLEIEGRIVGYFVVLYRKGSGVARLYSIAVDPVAAGSGLGRELLKAAEAAAFRSDCLLLRLEVREDNPRALELYLRNGYHQIGSHTGYYEDGATALRFEKILRGEGTQAGGVPYYEQTADFTCGPCCIMMAKGHFDPNFVPDPVKEIRLWREATTVFMMSGPGGCEPFGIAVAAHDNGLSTEIFVSIEGPLFLQSVRDNEKRRVMQLAQIDFRERAERHQIPVNLRAFTLDDLRGALGAGRLVMVLVSGYLMFGKKVPHWVLAIGDDGAHIVIHDPWVEDERGETAADAASIPVPYSIFMNMAQFGRPSLRAAVVLGDERTQ
jgi:ribosomal protein S18 acetylase RimI-like enzyme